MDLLNQVLDEKYLATISKHKSEAKLSIAVN